MEIKITSGGVLDKSDINLKHLVYNHLVDPKVGWDKLIMYAEKRYLFTMLVSGVQPGQANWGHGPVSGDKSTVRTIIKPIPQGPGTSDKFWTFSVMGAIARETVILRQVGTSALGSSARGGTFTLVAVDNTLKNQMNVVFPNGKYARIMREGMPNADGSVTLDFQCYPGDTFDWNTWMLGKNTAFGSFSTVGERSRQGYSNFFTPDKYINHTTTQRKAVNLSGDAQAQGIKYYEAEGRKGFTYVAEATVRQQFLLEDEDQKWNGISTMRDDYGNLLKDPSQYDEKGEPIIAGDGFINQIRGYNETIASGSDGLATLSDITDMIKALDAGRDHDNANPWYCITGSAGMDKAAELGRLLNQQMGIQYHVSLEKSSGVYGGQKVEAGFNTITLNISGKQVIFIENVQWNNVRKHPIVTANGASFQAATMIFMDISPAGEYENAVEIRARQGNGIDRNLVYSWFDGMTGGTEKPLHPGDFSAFHILKENMVCVYRPKSNGIIWPNAAMF